MYDQNEKQQSQKNSKSLGLFLNHSLYKDLLKYRMRTKTLDKKVYKKQTFPKTFGSQCL